MNGFQHVTSINEKPLISILEDNIKDFLNYSFLKIGGFIDVVIPTSGINGGDFSKLKPGYAPECPSGTVWEAPRKNWVYESEIDYNTSHPISITGVYVNNNLYPAPTGNNTLSYYINYTDGQIVFNKPIPLLSNVNVSYSYRYVQTYKANESFWFKELQQYSYDPSKITKSAGQLIMANHRVQLPCIIIETIPRTFQEPYQLGDTSNIISQDILLHVYTESAIQRNSIIDILLLQKDRQSFLYNIDNIVRDRVYSLDHRGSINPQRRNYDQILSSAIYRKNVYYISLANTSELTTISSNLYLGVVRWTLKIYP
jgi:hypothetical protein